MNNLDVCYRFFLAKDMNGDGATTISDVWAWIEYIFYLPAKIATAMLQGIPEVWRFFEMNCATGTGLGGAFFSLVVYAGIIITLVDYFEQKLGSTENA